LQHGIYRTVPAEIGKITTGCAYLPDRVASLEKIQRLALMKAVALYTGQDSDFDVESLD
jgi:hypothetical protein